LTQAFVHVVSLLFLNSAFGKEYAHPFAGEAAVYKMQPEQCIS
jgi:hypothetical protein